MPFNRDKFKRTELMLGASAMDRLENSSVTVIGLGAVGSHAIEALARSGIGTIRIVDFDEISTSNFNRQLLAVENNIGRKKTDAAFDRLKQINPDIKVEIFNTLCHEETFDLVFSNVSCNRDSSNHLAHNRIQDNHIQCNHSRAPHITGNNIPGNHGNCKKPSPPCQSLQPSHPSHVVIDAIDSLNPKVSILFEMVKREIPVVSSMGAARRKDPGAIKTGDISETMGCPLARSVRKRLKRRGIESGIHCVYSTEIASRESVSQSLEENFLKSGRQRNPMGSLSMISGIFGYIAALEALKIILGDMI
ncbi:MoeB2 [Desulfamplus magnetovallimortis]|uniref:MoeB2 n=1 Tax=Desulfamplus magnetovallimortis TaxID=1246637 RepID=A0A1W1HBK7_9BACT|nr:tRNA threonylcarbamoyladenosine dehydratase [Desulfamplus magnetovallimortis]SLM29823.1 MoeB2 [Desulfamplus magnetovallimortis]